MPANWLYMDANFPNFNGDESTEDKLAQVQNYLYMLVEQMRYTTQNLDTTNMNQTALAGWENALTSPIYAQIEGAGERITQLSATADGLTATVARQEETVTQLEGTVTGQGEQLESLTGQLTDFAQSVTGNLDELQAQIDGQIQTWFDSYIPTPDNAPANTWVTQEDKINHLGDIFYIVDNDTVGGQAYRWANVSGAYQWVLIEDVEVAKALADAARAQDTADGKRRVFVSQPTPPYDVGDLWAQGDGGDLMRCNTARASGSYVEEDWGRASDYTNDDALHEFVDGDYAQTKEEVTNQAQQILSQDTRISSLEVSADAISATVQRVQENTQASLDGVNEIISQLSEQVSLSMTEEQVQIAVEQQLSNGVETVRTSTGFTFDDEGLTVSKSGSEMSTQVTEDGMTISRSDTEVLVVGNQGVQATNLHANTFLIIGGRARFEKYGDRIGCFWIGG